MLIYKYTSLENAAKTLENGSVLLNNPYYYNDPFDCLIKPSEQEKEECYKMIVNYYMFKAFSALISDKRTKIPFALAWVRWMLKLFKSIMRKNPYYDKMPLFDWIMNLTLNDYCKKNPKFNELLNNEKEKFLKNVTKKIDEISESILVSCFSKTNKNILMWSHYGDKHRGACIEFEVDSSEFQKVNYSKRRRQLDLKQITAIALGYDYIGEQVDKNNMNIMKSLGKFFLTKSREWKYESEYRIVCSKNISRNNVYLSDNKYFLRMPKIKKVYFGCRTDANKVSELRKKYNDVEMILLKDSDDKYELVEEYGR